MLAEVDGVELLLSFEWAEWEWVEQLDGGVLKGFVVDFGLTFFLFLLLLLFHYNLGKWIGGFFGGKDWGVRLGTRRMGWDILRDLILLWIFLTEFNYFI